MIKTHKEIKLENNICDLAHAIVEIFYPQISQGSFRFINMKEKVIDIIKKNGIVNELERAIKEL